MVSKGNRSLKLAEYISSFGIDVNIGKNKARGNKGILIRRDKSCRIDINKDISEENITKILLHEFAHYVHSLRDKSLKSLEFAFGNIDENTMDELIKVTVEEVPKDEAKTLFNQKKEIEKRVKTISSDLKAIYSDFKPSQPFECIEKTLPWIVKHLLKYDKVRLLNKVYSVEKLEEQFSSLTDNQINYIKLKSQQRKLRRINSKITKLNNYYNQPTELFARFIELYYTNNTLASKLAPNTCQRYAEKIIEGSIPELAEIERYLV